MKTEEGFSVVNDKGRLVPCMDSGETAPHLAVWSSSQRAEVLAERMRSLNRGSGDPYVVERVRVIGMETAHHPMDLRLKEELLRA